MVDYTVAELDELHFQNKLMLKISDKVWKNEKSGHDYTLSILLVYYYTLSIQFTLVQKARNENHLKARMEQTLF